MPVSSNGVFGGIPAPSYMTGCSYIPHYIQATGVTVSTNANDLFYFPFFARKTQTFAGAKTFNQSAGDTGEKIRIGVYTDSASGPTTLVKAFGEITLGAASAEQTLSSSQSLTGPAWYWLAIHFDSATAMFGMASIQGVTAAGAVLPNILSSQLGTIGLQVNTTASSNRFCGMLVNTAYGSLASTAVAPTSTVAANAPIVGLFV